MPGFHLSFIFRCFVTAIAFVLISCLPDGLNRSSLLADDVFVSPTGDDQNDGTQANPWRTVRAACARLKPGDRLLIAPGEYLNEGLIAVRETDFETGLQRPLCGNSRSGVVITSSSDTELPVIHGSFDIRGCYIQLSRLEVVGDQESTLPGIGVYESFRIQINDCVVTGHGGGGIQLNYSDLVIVERNVTSFNATRNPDQHSGISSYQPIVRSASKQVVGLMIRDNISFGNENVVKNEERKISDGNGIILDDHRYQQSTLVRDSLLAGVDSLPGSTGTPVIKVDENGAPLPYGRDSVVRDNLCFDNGGRGIHVFLSSRARILFNVCESNLRSSAIAKQIPRLRKDRLFQFGEITVADSTGVLVRGNRAKATENGSAAAAELMFDLNSVGKVNTFEQNIWEQTNSAVPLVCPFNAPESDLWQDLTSEAQEKKNGRR